jgi:hypothetical protein
MYDSAILATLPDQGLSNEQIIKNYGTFANYYRLSALFYCRAYNRLPTRDYDKTQIGVGGSEVTQIQDNFLYAMGLQANTNVYLGQIEGTNGEVEDLSTPFMPGKDTYTIVNFLRGQFLGVAASAEPRVNVINPDMKNEATKKLKMVQVARKFEKQLEKIKQDTGYEFVPPADPRGTEEDVAKTIFLSFATDLSHDAGLILDYVRTNNMNAQDYSRQFMNVTIGRRAILYVTEEGRIEDVPPYMYFAMSAKDDDFGRYDVSRGKINFIHKDAAIAKYRKWLSNEDIVQIRNGSFTNTTIFTQLAALYNYTLFNSINQYMSEITVYWKATIDSGYKVVKDQDGDKVAIKLKSGKGKKGSPVQVIRKATLLANMFIVDYGVHDVIDDPNQTGNKLFPIMCFQPDTYIGINQCLVDQLKPKQKELDAISYRVRENYTMDLGTIIAMNGKKFKNGMTPTQIYSQLRKTRFTVSTASGEDGDYTDREPMMQKEDVSLMRDIQNYLSIKESMKAELKEIANVSSAIMGTQTGYIGLRTQQNSAGLASNSIQYTMTGVIQLFADAAQYAIELVKNDIQKHPDKLKWQSLLGEEGVQRIVDLKDDTYTQFMLYISTRDIIDPARKARMLSALDNLMATGQIDFADWLNVEDAKTISELKDYAKYSVAKKREVQRIQEMMANATRLQTTEAMAEGQAQTKQVEMRGNIAKQTVASVGNMAKEMLKQGYSQEEIAEFMNGAAGGQPSQGAPQGGEQGMAPEQMQQGGGGGIPPEVMQQMMQSQGGQPPMQ